MKHAILLFLLSSLLFAQTKQSDSNLFIIHEAFTFDSDADGYCDSIRVTLMLSASEEALTVTDIDSLSYSFNENSTNPTVCTDFEISSDREFSFRTPYSMKSGNASLTIYTKEGNVSGTIQDKIGPVPVDVLVITGTYPVRDTLLLQCSEEISTNIPQEITIRVKDGANSTDLISENCFLISNTELCATFQRDSFFDCDSLALLHNSGITDTSGNRPTDALRYKPIQFHIVTPILNKTITPNQSISMRNARITVTQNAPFSYEVYGSNGVLMHHATNKRNSVDLRSLGLASGVYQIIITQQKNHWKGSFIID